MQASDIEKAAPAGYKFKAIKPDVKAGDKVNCGDTLFTMEAMKMQSNYKVASDCTIKEVLIKDGDTMNVNDLVMKLVV